MDVSLPVEALIFFRLLLSNCLNWKIYCDDQSSLCPYIDNERTNYTFNNTGEVREIKQQMTCKSTNLICMIECKRCKNQYIGETKRTLRERFTEHRQTTNNPITPKPQQQYQHISTYLITLLKTWHSFHSSFNQHSIPHAGKQGRPIWHTEAKR